MFAILKRQVFLKFLPRLDVHKSASICLVLGTLWFAALLAASVYAQGSISFDQTITGAINQNSNRQDTFRFDGFEGDSVRITMRRTSQCLDTYIKLLAPSGDQIGLQDDIGDWRDCSANGGDSILNNVRLPRTGTYTIVAAGYWLVDGRSPQSQRRYNNGGYRLKLTLLSEGPERQQTVSIPERTIDLNQATIDENGYRLIVPHGLHTISIRQIWHTNCAEIGSDLVCRIPPIAVASIDGWVEQGITFCFPQTGKMLFMPNKDRSGNHIVWNSVPAPAPWDIAYSHSSGFTCSQLNQAGKLVLARSGATVDSQPGDPGQNGGTAGGAPVATARPTPTPTPARSNSPIINVCDLPPRLQLGGTAIRAAGANSSLRSQPTIQGDWLGSVAGGTTVAVQDGPRYSENYTWYQVRVPGLDIGWVAESGRAFEDCVYFFSPGRGLASPAGGGSAGAGTIRYGQTVRGSLGDSAPYRSYVFQASAGDVISVAFQRASGDVDPRIQIWDDNSNRLVNKSGRSATGIAALNAYVVPRSGRYELQAHRDEGSGSFTMTLSGGSPTATPTPSPRPIAIGDTASGELSEEFSYHNYTFNARINDMITIHMQATGGNIDPLLKLWDGAGNEIASDDNGGGGRNALIFDFLIPRGGLYTVQSHRKANTAGSYRLQITRREPTPTPGQTRAPISSNSSVTGWVGGGNDDEWRFTAEPGDEITLAAHRTEGDFIPVIRLYDGDGNLLQEEVNANGSLSAGLSEDSADGGAYLVSVGRRAGGSGNYQLAMNIERAAVREPIDRDISPGETVSAYRDMRSDLDYYRFSANADQLISITIRSANGDLKPQLFLLKDSNELLGGDFNAGGAGSATVSDVSAPYSGRYTIMVDQLRGAGDYSLSLQITTPVPAQIVSTISSGQTVNGHVTEGPWDQWRFSVSAGEKIRIEMRRTGGSVQPRIYLNDVSGGSLAQSPLQGDGLQTRLSVRAPYSGDYVISAGRICEPGACGTGAYSLSLEALPPAQIVSSISSGQTVNGHVTEGPWDQWRFTASQDSKISISMTRSSGDWQPRIFLQDGSGNLLIEAPPLSDRSVSRFFDFNAPRSGDYVISAGRFCPPCGRGAYSLSLTVGAPPPEPVPEPDPEPVPEPDTPVEPPDDFVGPPAPDPVPEPADPGDDFVGPPEPDDPPDDFVGPPAPDPAPEPADPGDDFVGPPEPDDPPDDFVGPPAPDDDDATEEATEEPTEDSTEEPTEEAGDRSGATIRIKGDCTLANAIAAANTDRSSGGCPTGNGPDTIILNGNLTLGAALPTITSDIKIDGGTTLGLGGKRAISGNNQRRIFTVGTTGTLRLQDLKLTNGRAYEGGAIYNSGAVTILDVDFANSHANSRGGAIFNDDSATITVADASFSSVSADSDGGAIYNNGSLTTAKNKTFGSFEKNSASNNGGAIFNNGTMAIAGAAFDDNDATNNGGAIFNSYGTLSLSSVTIKNGEVDSKGGAIYNSAALNCVSCTISDNSAGRDGGAIFNSGTVTLTSGQLKQNTAGGDSFGRGGAIYNSSSGKVTVGAGAIQFTDNQATRDGGAIYNRNTLTLGPDFASTWDMPYFSGNSAGYRGGALYDDFASACIYGTGMPRRRFSGNSDESDSGICFGCVTVKTATSIVGIDYPGAHMKTQPAINKLCRCHKLDAPGEDNCADE